MLFRTNEEREIDDRKMVKRRNIKTILLGTLNVWSHVRKIAFLLSSSMNVPKLRFADLSSWTFGP
jgi:hypothetical protein